MKPGTRRSFYIKGVLLKGSDPFNTFDSAWQAIQRSFAPIGVPAVFSNVNCVA